MPKSNPYRNTTVAVLGLGTAMTSLCSLHEAGIDAEGFDTGNQVGGHIQSIPIEIQHGVNKKKIYILEGGAEFIGNPQHYPHVHQMFAYLNLELKKFQLSHTLSNLNTGQEFISPPPSNFLSKLMFFCCIPKDRREQLLQDLVSKLSMLKVSNLAAEEGQSIDDKPERFRTIEEFMNEYEWAGDDKEFLETYFYYLIAAAWGVRDVEQIKAFGAHYALHYLSLGTDWYDAPGGLSEYMERLKAGIPEERINLNTAIDQLEAIREGDRYVYKLKKEDGTDVLDENGAPKIYTDVMLSMNAEIMCKVLPKGIDADIDALITLLEAVEYYDTTVLFHTDDSYRSSTDTVVHTIVDADGIAANTACKHFKYKDGVRIYKTWWHEGQGEPQDIKARRTYRHPIMDERYFHAQEKLRAMQGHLGLHFGGILAGERDSHEEGMKAAAYVATNIASREGKLEESPLLNAVFPDIVERFKGNPNTSPDDVRRAGHSFMG